MGRFKFLLAILLWELAGILQPEAIIFLGRPAVITKLPLE